MPEETPLSLRLLYCYAREDRHWPEEIDRRFSNLKRQCRIISQLDGELVPGIGQKARYLSRLPETHVVLLLLSPYFKKVASFWDDICHESWAVRWLGGCRVVALLLEPGYGDEAPFSTRDVLPRTARPLIDWRDAEPVDPLHVFPGDVKPLTTWQSQDSAFQEIEGGMRDIIEKQWLARGDYYRLDGGGTLDTKALAAYNETLRLNPSISRAWHGKAYALVGLQRYNEAVEAANEAIRLNSFYAWSWFIKGIALANLKRYDGAIGAYNEALMLDPWNEDFQRERLKALQDRMNG